MPSKDGGDYRQARRKDSASQGKPPEDEAMFFGASPTQKKELRETKDKRSINLDSLDLDALDRDRFGAGEKVGKSMRLIDMAIEDEKPTRAQGRARARRPQRGRPGPGRRAGPPGRRPAPGRGRPTAARGRPAPGRRAGPPGRARPSGRVARPSGRAARPTRGRGPAPRGRPGRRPPTRRGPRPR